MNKSHIVGVIVALVAVGGGAFYAGTSYAKSGTPTRGQFNTTFTAGGSNFTAKGAARGGGFTAGQILSSSNNSITIEQQNGSSTEIVLISPSTQILKTVVGSASDLSLGMQVVVTGTSNSDGSLTANSIQLRPAGMSNASIMMHAGTGDTSQVQ